MRAIEFRVRNLRQPGDRRGAIQILDALGGIQRFHLRAQQSRKLPALGHRDQEPGTGIAQDAGLAAQMILDLRKPHRRVDRHRNGAGIKNAEESNEKIDAGRQHHGDAVARDDILGDQAASQVAGFGGEFAVCQRAENGRLILQYGQMQTVRMAGRMPFQNLDQGLCFAGSRHRR